MIQRMFPEIPSRFPPAQPDLKGFRPPILNGSQSRSNSQQYYKYKCRYMFWRARMWVEGTFGLAVLEPWEKALLLTIFTISSIFFIAAIIQYLPQHVSDMRGRLLYYLFGSSDSTSSPPSSPDDTHGYCSI
ncbi:hypothetical protein F5880DRAFT_904489 [Lentinula raphanica]|nr:hypothetical protein F5880DRAFT_904489 [Lentinula raphanica]